GIVAGVVATGVAMYKLGSYAEAESEQLATLSQHLRATRADYADMAQAANDAADHLSATSGLSTDDSRSTTATFAAIPTLGSSDLSGLASEATDLA
ncbi:hypothetical protein, partial [Gluconobacter sp. Gdi]|uniref:hypothetical protein n=1 Tax=Gluconobacter sp. Gdi TaxID=2691888 RepID=UPI0019204CB6